MSGVFQQVMYQLGIKQYTSSAYHPQSQGALKKVPPSTQEYVTGLVL